MSLFLQAILVFIFVCLCFLHITERTCTHFQEGKGNSHCYNITNPEVSAMEPIAISTPCYALATGKFKHFFEREPMRKVN